MLNLNRIYFCIFVFMMLNMFFSVVLIKYADELGALLLLTVAGIDIIVNNNIRKYALLFILIGIFTFYTIYSLAFMRFNVYYAIITDAILQLKPFIPFVITYAIAPYFTQKMKRVLKILSIILAAGTFLIFFTPLYNMALGHVAHLGLICFNSFAIYVFCSIDDKGTVSKRDLIIAFSMVLAGLFCTRSKYYAEVVMIFFFFLIYRPGMLKTISIKQIVIICLVFITVMTVVWEKFNYYFLTGNEGEISEEIIQSFARPVLYITMGSVLLDYPLLGSGLASFATYASSPYTDSGGIPFVKYSSLYREYDIDQVWGISEDVPDFICDAFFTEMAQFGLVGIILFIYFWVWIYRKLRLSLHLNCKYQFIIGTLIIFFVQIESTTGAVFIQTSGMVSMMLLGTIVAPYKNIDTKEQKEILESSLN